MYGNPYSITFHQLQIDREQIVWSVAHDAYEKLKPPVKFNRDVKFKIEDQSFLVGDKLETAGNHLYEIFFHLHPECQISDNQNTIYIYRGKVKICMHIDPRLIIRFFRGSYDPVFGWFSKRFNHIEETTTIVCSSHFSGNVSYFNTINIL